MKRSNIFVMIASAIILLSFSACTDNFMQEVPGRAGHQHRHGYGPQVLRVNSIISTDWLNKIMDYDDVVVVDVRTVEEYAAGHIPGSINLPFVVPFSGWCTTGPFIMELPAVADLEAMLSNAGVSNASKVVLVTGVGQPPFPNAAGPRVAATLNYLGFNEVAILNGGFNKWVAEGRAVATETTVLPEASFVANPVEGLFVDIAYVEASIGNKIIVDGRDPVVYSGEVVEPWALKPGHIPSALSLPAIFMWNEDGTYKTKNELAQVVVDAIGQVSRNEEIIIYCGVGGYATVLYYVMHDVLGYKNLKIFDGAAEQWSQVHDMEL